MLARVQIYECITRLTISTSDNNTNAAGLEIYHIMNVRFLLYVTGGGL